MRQSRFTNARKRSIAPRRGTILILFALFLFGFMGLAALVIDLGFVRLTQLQMQSAADSAAMEGMWLQGESNQRERVRDHVQYVFDDDFELANDEQDFGAGPRLTFSEGIPLTSEFNASELIEYPPADPVYKPRLELNEKNEPYGDMVAVDGTFQVQLRRTSGTNPDDRITGVSSSGSAIPYLFGRGGLLHPTLRGRGVSVRATGLASGEPAKSVGVRFPLSLEDYAVANDDDRWIGLFPIQFNLEYWNSSSQSPEIEPTGDIVDPNFVGTAGQAISDAEPVVLSDEPVVGSFIDFNAVAMTDLPGYVPIVAPVLNADGIGSPTRVIGFGLIRITKTAASNQFTFTVTNPAFAPHNASAVFVRIPSDPNIDWGTLMSIHNELNNPLLAPASVR